MLKKIKKLLNNKGEVYIGEGAKIVICIVLGAAILAGLVLVTNKVVLPKTKEYFENSMNQSNKYIGIVSHEMIKAYADDDEVSRVVALADSPTFLAYKDDDTLNWGYALLLGCLYGNNDYGVTPEMAKESLENLAIDPNATQTERDFAASALLEWDYAQSYQSDPRVQACSDELCYVLVHAEAGGYADDNAMLDAVGNVAEKYGYDRDVMIEIIFG